jgi:hypothetical protein
MGLIGLVVTIDFSFGSNPKVDDVALNVFVLVPISTNTKKGGSYFKSTNLGNSSW